MKYFILNVIIKKRGKNNEQIMIVCVTVLTLIVRLVVFVHCADVLTLCVKWLLWCLLYYKIVSILCNAGRTQVST